MLNQQLTYGFWRQASASSRCARPGREMKHSIIGYWLGAVACHFQCRTQQKRRRREPLKQARAYILNQQ